jgi:hypothetical protein
MELELDKLWVWDIETYPNCFLFAITRADGKHEKVFEVSFQSNEINRIEACIDYIKEQGHDMVGFNSLGFDYPVIHRLLTECKVQTGKAIADKVWKYAQEQIDSFKDGFGSSVKTDDRLVPQIDLYRIWHFNNKAKATSLKMLEFNMREQNIEDLPYPVGSYLDSDQIKKLKEYNLHDVRMTLVFLKASKSQVQFRKQLSAKYNRNFMNHDDTKIGADYFVMKLEEAGIPLYKYKNGKKAMNQTPRPEIDLSECLFDYYDFTRPEFIAVKDWFDSQIITETKGVFSDIEEHRLGAVAQYAEMQVKKTKFKTKPSDLEIKKFKKDYPLGWVEEEELKATEYLMDSEGNHITENIVDTKGKVKVKKVRVPKKSYWGCWNEAETLNVVVEGFRYDFGVGGIHGSLLNKVVKETSKYFIRDADV